MKKRTRILSLLIILLLPLSFAYAQYVKVNNSFGPHGFTKIQSRSDLLEISFSLDEFSIIETELNNKSVHQIIVQDNFLMGAEGAPALPSYNRYIAVPEGASIEIVIDKINEQEYQNLIIPPNPEIPLTTDDNPLSYIKNPEIYQRDAMYPASVTQISSNKKIRGVNTVLLSLNPFRYNPVTNTLKVTTDIRFRVLFKEGNGAIVEEKYRNRYWDVILSDLILNYDILPEINFAKQYDKSKDTGCEYLIITPTGEDFLFWADSIRKFRTRQGILTQVVTTEEIGANNVYAIQNYLDDAYNTWDIPPIACLIMADYGNNQEQQITAPIWQGYCVSDNIWGDVDNDDLPDIVMARMTANNNEQLETMVTKFIHHELSPPTYESFYQMPITALGWQTERWFQLCSESVGGFWRNELNKEPIRINEIYDGTPNNIWSTATNTGIITSTFGPNGLDYIPQYPWQLGGWEGGSPQDIIDAINNGSFMMVHRDHGYEYGWGEPAFNTNHIDQLENEDLIFVWSVNCLTGKYNLGQECFTEKFHRHMHDGYNSGALGLIAASEVSYSFVNDTYVWGAMDNMWPTFLPAYGTAFPDRYVLPAFASAAGKYFLDQSNWASPDAKAVTYHLFHHHGDAFLNVYTEVPQPLTVEHDPVILFDQGYFEISVDENAFIALSIDNELIATADGTGELQSISIPQLSAPGKLFVTITKQNYFRYETEVSIIDPAGAYITYTGFELNDAIGGNNNGMVEPLENIYTSLTLKNVGVSNAENFTVSLESLSSYVEIIDGEQTVDGLNAGESIDLQEAFNFTLSNEAPDYHIAKINVNIDHSGEIWQTNFQFIVHSPRLAFQGISFDDSQGGNGNGFLETGESALLNIELLNTGSGMAESIYLDMTTYSPYLQFINEVLEPAAISPEEEVSIPFEIEISENTPVGSPAFFSYFLDHNGGIMEDMLNTSIGIISEDWETGDLSQFDWSLVGNAEWEFNTETVFDGIYSLGSGDIDHNQQSTLFLEYYVGIEDSISFWVKASSDPNDILIFKINQTTMGEFSGEEDWHYVSYPIPEGTNYIQWRFERNQSGSGGENKVWIDNIKLPPGKTLAAYAGEDGDICENDTFICRGFAFNAEDINWNTTGDGSFDNPGILNAIYTPGSQDISDGSVNLIIEATLDELMESDEMTLSIFPSPVVEVGENLEVVAGEDLNLVGMQAENYASLWWESSGDGSFDQQDLLNPVYTPGTQDLEEGTFELCLTALPLSSCIESTDCLTVTVDYQGIAELNIDNILSIYPNPNQGEFTIELIPSATMDDSMISIFNSQGVKVFENYLNHHRLQITLPEKGIYLIGIHLDGRIHYKKVIVL